MSGRWRRGSSFTHSQRCFPIFDTLYYPPSAFYDTSQQHCSALRSAAVYSFGSPTLLFMT